MKSVPVLSSLSLGLALVLALACGNDSGTTAPATPAATAPATETPAPAEPAYTPPVSAETGPACCLSPREGLAMESYNWLDGSGGCASSMTLFRGPACELVCCHFEGGGGGAPPMDSPYPRGSCGDVVDDARCEGLAGYDGDAYIDWDLRMAKAAPATPTTPAKAAEPAPAATTPAAPAPEPAKTMTRPGSTEPSPAPAPSGTSKKMTRPGR